MFMTCPEPQVAAQIMGSRNIRFITCPGLPLSAQAVDYSIAESSSREHPRAPSRRTGTAYIHFVTSRQLQAAIHGCGIADAQCAARQALERSFLELPLANLCQALMQFQASLSRRSDRCPSSRGEDSQGQLLWTISEGPGSLGFRRRDRCANAKSLGQSAGAVALASRWHSLSGRFSPLPGLLRPIRRSQALLGELLEKLPLWVSSRMSRLGFPGLQGLPGFQDRRQWWAVSAQRVEASLRRWMAAASRQSAEVHLGRRLDPIVRLSDCEPRRGDTVVLLVTVPPARGLIDRLQLALLEHLRKGALVEVTYGGARTPCYPMVAEPATWRALIASTPLDEPGVRKLTVQVRDGRHRLYLGEVQLRGRDYPVESIWLPEGKVGLKGTAEEMEAVGAFRSSQSQAQQWRLPLKAPCEGEVTTEYGLQRYYDGVFAQGYYHRGIDYGADVGAPVLAPAAGRVALIGREGEGFALHGNCVGVDHGQGVTSLLMHLDTIETREGAFVEAGEVVGSVGSTGMATGPHLHWGLYVNGECIDPKEWMKPQPWG